MIVVAALGLDFGLVRWPACAILGAALVSPLLLPAITLMELVVIYAIAGLLAGLVMPPIVPGCRRGTIARPPVPPPIGIPVAVPPSDDQVGTDSPDP